MFWQNKYVLKNAQSSFSRRLQGTFTLKIILTFSLTKQCVFHRCYLRILFISVGPLFYEAALSGCFFLKNSFVKLVASEVKAKRCSKNNCSEVCDQNPLKMHVNTLIFSKTRSPQLFSKIIACAFFNTNETGNFQELLFKGASW